MAGVIAFLQMNIGTIIIGAVVLLVAFLAFRSVFIKKSIGCDGKCGSCKGGCH